MSVLLPPPDLQYLPVPFIAEGSRIAAFLVPAASGSLQRLLDTGLNPATTPAGHPTVQRFRPLRGLDHLVLTFIHYPKVFAQQSGIPPANQWGAFSYDECAVFLMLEDTQPGGVGVCWHLPFVLVSRGMPMVLGREVYGVPKMIGALDLQPLLDDDWMDAWSGSLSVATDGFPQRGDTFDSRSVPVAEVTLAASIPGPPLLGELLHSDVFGFMQSFFGAGLPGIFLKQFPDVEGATQAIYRTPMQAQFTPTNIGSQSFKAAAVEIFDPASYPLASTFGIAPGQAIPAVGMFMKSTWMLQLASPL